MPATTRTPRSRRRGQKIRLPALLQGERAFRHIPYCVRCQKPLDVYLSDPTIKCSRCAWTTHLTPKQYRRWVRTCGGAWLKHWQTIPGPNGTYWIKAGNPPRELLPGRAMETMELNEEGVCNV
jgi:hypothetical protein